MLILADVLAPEDLTRLREGLKGVAFRDGRATAGPAARAVKANRQADPADPAVAALGRFAREALERHPVFQAWARPAKTSTVIFSRYGPGDAYGEHVDDAFLAAADGGRLRTDLSFTLFLSDPETYEGGALTVSGPDGERSARPAAGAAVLYETGRPHRVEPVTRGERLAAVGWVQSLIRRADRREVLFDLARVRAALPAGEARLTADKAIGDLLRMWGEG